MDESRIVFGLMACFGLLIVKAARHEMLKSARAHGTKVALTGLAWLIVGLFAIMAIVPRPA